MIKYSVVCVGQGGEEDVMGRDLDKFQALSLLDELLSDEEEGESYLVRETESDDEVSEDIDADEEDEDSREE